MFLTVWLERDGSSFKDESRREDFMGLYDVLGCYMGIVETANTVLSFVDGRAYK